MSDFQWRPTITVGGHAYPVFDADIPAAWQEIAEEKGYDIVTRVRDRYHLVLRHEDCGADMVCKAFTLRTSIPICPNCLDIKRRALCTAAGVTYVGRGERPNYFRILQPCGHEAIRQQELLERVRQGKIEIRCEECLGERLKAEARSRDWELIGDDPWDDRSYRLYRHDCGHRQRIAVANMATGRLACGSCSQGWTGDPSFIYAMRFILKNGRDAIKVGYSKVPQSRLRHQLITERDQYAMVIRTIPIPTGHLAIILEKRLHATLARRHPEAVLDRSEFADEVRVVSELYCASIEPEIMALLDDLEARMTALAKRKAKLARRDQRRQTRRNRRRHRSGKRERR